MVFPGGRAGRVGMTILQRTAAGVADVSVKVTVPVGVGAPLGGVKVARNGTSVLTLNVLEGGVKFRFAVAVVTVCVIELMLPLKFGSRV